MGRTAPPTLMDKFPFPPGTLVLCFGSHGLPIRRTCADHIFETTSDAQSVDYGCGFVQAARCIVCRYHTQAIDADFWATPADEVAVKRCMEWIDEAVVGLTEARTYIQDRATGNPRPVLKDFG